MIQAYKSNNQNFDMNGTVLLPTLCDIHLILDSGNWELTLEHPIDQYEKWKSIESDGVIKAPLFNKDQLFKITKIQKRDSGILVTAKPIFLTAKEDCCLDDIRPTEKNGQEALDIMMNGTRYSGSSDITKRASAYYVRKNLIEAINGDGQNTFISRWGGEIYYDNFKIIINERIGADRGVRVAYGKNVKRDGIEEIVNTEDVITRIYPIAFNGRQLSTKYVDSPNISNYPNVKFKYIDYSDIKLLEDVEDEEDTSDITVCETQAQLDAALRERANEDFSKGLDKPLVTIEVDMELVENASVYEEVKALEEIHLGDTVHCYHDRLGISTEARIIEMTVDAIRQKTKDCVIGSAKYDYFKDSNDTINSFNQVINKEDNTILGEKISGLLNLFNVKLSAQRSTAQKQNVRAILFEDLDPNSPTYGATCYGTAGLEYTNTRNETDTDWVWNNSNAFGPNGLIANAIITGLLSDKLGLNYWDLDKGELVTKKGVIGGFDITEEGLIKTYETKLKKVYTQDDITRLRNIIEGTIQPTESDYYYYDVDESGTFTASDYVKIKQFYVPANGDVVYTDLIINSYALDLVNLETTFITLRYRGKDNKIIALTRLGPTKVDTNYVTALSVDAMDMFIEGESLAIRGGDGYWSSGGYNAHGRITSSGKRLEFSIPVGPRMIGVNSITCTQLCMNLRKVEGGYVGEGYVEGGYDYVDNSNYTITCYPRPNTNSITVRVVQNVTYATTNNTPIDVDIIDATFEFN